MDILLELYDKHNIDNIIAIVHNRYDKVIYFGKEDDPPEETKVFLHEFIMNHFRIPAEFVTVTDVTVKGIAETVSKQINGNDSYTVDLSGGSEEFCAALGYIALSRSNVQICRHKISSDSDGFLAELTLKDLVALGGGAVLDVTDENSKVVNEKNFTNGVLHLWDAVKNISTDWNRFCSLPSDKLPAGEITRKITKKNDKLSCERVLRELKKHKLVREYSVETNKDKGIARYFLSSSVKYPFLYDKSGTVLEYYSCLSAIKTGLFRDCGVGAILDLNGIISDSPAEPRNELDLTMCSGVIPYFVSCKNCQPTKEFLYEIKALADHFKGVYAVPALISSLPANKAVNNRAAEMGIVLIDNVSQMSLKQLSDKIGELRKIR